MASGSIGYSGSQLAMDGTARSINCTLAANEYPTSFTITNLGGNSAHWFHNSSASETFTLYLSNSTKSIYYTLGTISFTGLGANVTANTFSANCPNLKGQALYIYGDGHSVQLRNYATISIGTAIVQTHPTVSGGDPITKTQMDTLRSYLGKGNVVSQYTQATAVDGNTYKNGLTKDVTPIDDAWYNNA